MKNIQPIDINLISTKVDANHYWHPDPLLHHEQLVKYGIDTLKANELVMGITLFVADVLNGRIRCASNGSGDNQAGKVLNGYETHHLQNIHGYILVARCLSKQFEYRQALSIFCESIALACNICGSHGISSEQIDQTVVNWKQNGIAYLFMNSLADAICYLYRDMGFAQRMADERQYVKRSLRSSSKYIDDIISAHGRIVVVRVDFYQQIGQCVESDLQLAIASMDRLIANIRHNSIFHGLVGYIAKLEYGIVRGAHWHTVFFYDGQYRNPNDHVYFAKQIGEYWRNELNCGNGTYYNCNADSSKYDTFGLDGTGLITYRDLDKIQILKEKVVSYLCKTNLFSRIKGGKPYRTFRRGQCPVAQLRCPRKM